MQCYLITGEKEKAMEFIAEFIGKKNIKPFDILKIEEKIKIGNVREIKKMLTFRQAEERLIVILGGFTPEAQNALLKTLEEVPENNTFIIYAENKEKLLPTVVSRCFVISYGAGVKATDSFEKVKELFLKFLESENSAYPASAVSFSDKVILTLADADEKEKVILAVLRSILLENIDDRLLIKIYGLLDSFSKIYPLIVNNNVNLRFSLENIMLRSF